MIKFKNPIMRNLTVILWIIICVFLTGCPGYIPKEEEIRSGELFRAYLTTTFYNVYGVVFSKANLPTIKIDYQLSDGTIKKATFILDGYDDERKIGYRLVTLDDAAKWGNLRKEGNLEVPDLNDVSIIESKAIKYNFPVLFLWSPNYDKPENFNKLNFKLEELLETDVMKEWIDNHSKDNNDEVKMNETIIKTPIE